MKNPPPTFWQDTKLTLEHLTHQSTLFVSSKIIPGIGNTVHLGGTYDFKGIFEVGGGYKSTRYMNVMAIVKTKFGLSLAYAYDFRGASNDVEVQRSGSEIFLKFTF